MYTTSSSALTILKPYITGKLKVLSSDSEQENHRQENKINDTRERVYLEDYRLQVWSNKDPVYFLQKYHASLSSSEYLELSSS